MTKQDLMALYEDYFETAQRANRAPLPFKTWLLFYKQSVRG